MCPDSTTPESSPTTSSGSSSNSGAGSQMQLSRPKGDRSSFSSQESQNFVSSSGEFHEWLEHGIHNEIKATDGLPSENRATPPTQILVHTFDRQEDPQVLVQDGLEWEQGTFDITPAWSFEPSAHAVADVVMEELRRRNLISTWNLSTTPVLEFQGAFNKLYSVPTDNASYLMRLSLPVDPLFKTWSEASTIAFLHAKTTIPLPRVIAYSSSTKSKIGFEWMLMERVVGAYPMKEVWQRMSRVARLKLIEDVASTLGQLFDVRADAIGSIYLLDAASCKGKNVSPFVVSRMVSMSFFWGGHIHLDHIPRGPFTSSRDWLHARLQILLHDCTVLLESSSSSANDKEDCSRTQAMANRLLELLPVIFPVEREAFALHHGDLSRHNILLDHAGTLKAIVDWECTSTMPLFMCCQLPGFLESRERLDEPDSKEYGEQPNENSLYQEHLSDYVLSLLRIDFIKFMEVNYPAWATEYHASGAKRQFEHAVSMCDDAYSLGEIEGWLDRVEREYLQSD